MTKNQYSIIKAGVGVLALIASAFVPTHAAQLSMLGVSLLGWAAPRLGSDPKVKS